jgi:hypothetical protein
MVCLTWDNIPYARVKWGQTLQIISKTSRHMVNFFLKVNKLWWNHKRSNLMTKKDYIYIYICFSPKKFLSLLVQQLSYKYIVYVYAHTNVYIYVYMCNIVALTHTFIKFVHIYFPFKNSITIKMFDGSRWQTNLTDWIKAMKTPLLTERLPICNYW